MVDGISEEIQQLIHDYAASIRRTGEQGNSWAQKEASNEEFELALVEEGKAFSALTLAIAELSNNADCQKLERESAEQDVLGMQR